MSYSFEHSGPLVKAKEGMFGLGWKKRWCEIKQSASHGYALTYYEAHGDIWPAGIIVLDDCTVQDVNDDPKHPNAFKVSHAKRKDVIFEALNELERTQWTSALRKCIAFLDNPTGYVDEKDDVVASNTKRSSGGGAAKRGGGGGGEHSNKSSNSSKKSTLKATAAATGGGAKKKNSRKNSGAAKKKASAAKATVDDVDDDDDDDEDDDDLL